MFGPVGIYEDAYLNMNPADAAVVNGRTDVSKYSLSCLSLRRSDIFLVNENEVSYDQVIAQ